MDQFETAIEYLDQALKINQKIQADTKEIQVQIAKCNQLHKEKLARETPLYTGIFNKLNKEEGLYQGVEPGKPLRWKCHYCGEEMDQIQQARHIIKMHSGDKKDKVSKKDLGLPDQIPLDLKVTPKS